MDRKRNISAVRVTSTNSGLRQISRQCPLRTTKRRAFLLTRIFALLGALLIAGCSINQQVAPVPRMEIREICIIDNPEVRADFLDAYQKALRAKGFQTTTLNQSSGLTDCQFISTYTANWRWDLALYMAFAEIKIYDNGKQIGSALYDSLGGGGNLNKFISADRKIQELVNQLFASTDLAQQPVQ